MLPQQVVLEVFGGRLRHLASRDSPFVKPWSSISRRALATKKTGTSCRKDHALVILLDHQHHMALVGSLAILVTDKVLDPLDGAHPIRQGQFPAMLGFQPVQPEFLALTTPLCTSSARAAHGMHHALQAGPQTPSPTCNTTLVFQNVERAWICPRWQSWVMTFSTLAREADLQLSRTFCMNANVRRHLPRPTRRVQVSKQSIAVLTAFWIRDHDFCHGKT